MALRFKKSPFKSDGAIVALGFRTLININEFKWHHSVSRIWDSGDNGICCLGFRTLIKTNVAISNNDANGDNVAIWFKGQFLKAYWYWIAPLPSLKWRQWYLILIACGDNCSRHWWSIHCRQGRCIGNGFWLSPLSKFRKNFTDDYIAVSSFPHFL